MYKLSCAAKIIMAANIYLCLEKSFKAGIIECPATTFYPLHRLFCVASLCTLRTKLTRNLDAWLAQKKICILCFLDVLLSESWIKQECAESVSYYRIRPINITRPLTHL